MTFFNLSYLKFSHKSNLLFLCMAVEIPVIERTISFLLTKALKRYPEFQDVEVTHEQAEHIRTKSVEIAVAVTGVAFNDQSPSDLLGTVYSQYGVLVDPRFAQTSIDMFFPASIKPAQGLDEAVFEFKFSRDESLTPSTPSLSISCLIIAFDKDIKVDISDKITLTTSIHSPLLESILLYTSTGVCIPSNEYSKSLDVLGDLIITFNEQQPQYVFSVFAMVPDLSRSRSLPIEDFSYVKDVIPGLDFKLGKVIKGDAYVIRTTPEPSIAYELYGGQQLTSITISVEAETRLLRSSTLSRILEALRFIKQLTSPFGWVLQDMSGSLSDGSDFDAATIAENAEALVTINHPWQLYLPIKSTFLSVSTMEVDTLKDVEPLEISTIPCYGQWFQ